MTPEFGFYEEMQEVSDELFEAFQQNAGSIHLSRIPSQTPTTNRPYDKTPAAPVLTLLQAVALPVQRKYVDGTRITGRETQVMFSPPALDPEPQPSDRIQIDGRLRTTVDMKRIPDTGIALAYIFFVVD